MEKERIIALLSSPDREMALLGAYLLLASDPPPVPSGYKCNRPFSYMDSIAVVKGDWGVFIGHTMWSYGVRSIVEGIYGKRCNIIEMEDDE